MEKTEWGKIRISKNIRGARSAFFVYWLVFISMGALIVIAVEYATLDVYNLEAAVLRLWQSVAGVTILWSGIYLPAIMLQKAAIIGDNIEFTSFFVKKSIHHSNVTEINKFSRFLFSGIEIKETNGKILTILFYEIA